MTMEGLEEPHLSNLQEGTLPNCWSVVFKDTILISSGLLDSTVKCDEVLAFCKEIYQQHTLKSLVHPLRISVMQLDLVGFEWEQVQIQHQHLLAHFKEQEISLVHVCHPTDAFYLANDPDFFSEFAHKSFRRLLYDFNIEAMLTYVMWFNEESKKISNEFHPQASEEYQLKARLEDLHHEVSSPMLKNVWATLHSMIASRGEVVVKGDKKELLSLEKSLIIHREQLGKMLEVQHYLLQHIIEGIVKIEKQHPELLNLKSKAEVLGRFIEANQVATTDKTWGKNLLLMQALDELFGAISIVSASSYPERAAFTIAVRLAFSQLKRDYSIDALVAVCRSELPDAASKRLYHLLITKVIANLALFNRYTHVQAQESNWGINQDFLQFLPKKLKSGNTSLFITDGSKVQLTIDGKRYFNRLGMVF